jgi:hypothetical protein
MYVFEIWLHLNICNLEIFIDLVFACFDLIFACFGLFVN